MNRDKCAPPCYLSISSYRDKSWPLTVLAAPGTTWIYGRYMFHSPEYQMPKTIKMKNWKHRIVSLRCFIVISFSLELPAPAPAPMVSFFLQFSRWAYSRTSLLVLESQAQRSVLSSSLLSPSPTIHHWCSCILWTKHCYCLGVHRYRYLFWALEHFLDFPANC